MNRFAGFRSCLGAVLVAAACVVMTSETHAAPLTLTISTDTPYELKGAITGRIFETDFVSVIDNVPASFGYSDVSNYEFGTFGTNWHVRGGILKYRNFDNAGTLLSTTYGISLLGNHQVAPHPDEIAPNSLEMLVYADNITGETNAGPLRFPPMQLMDSKPHLVGPHFDTMILTLADLNGAAPGVVDGGDQFAASFVLSHPVPEPATWLMLLAGVGGLALAVRRRVVT